MQWLHIFALCLLIWLMTTKITKKVYCRNKNICLGVCMMVFMNINAFRNFISMKIGYLRVFMSINAFKNSFLYEKVRMFGEWVLNVWNLFVHFLKSKSIQANKCLRLPYLTLLMQIYSQCIENFKVIILRI